MKKQILFIFFLFIVSNIYANSINKEIAKRVAINWFAERNTGYNGTEAIKISEVITISEESETLFYIVNFTEQKGCVIVSADDTVIPVLGYNFSKNYTNENNPPAFDYWLGTYKEQILYVKRHETSALESTIAEWNRLNVPNSTFVARRDINAVAPLLQTTWHQLCNIYTPYDAQSNCSNTLVGCVATAMGQIMKHWNYPTANVPIPGYNDDDYGWINGVSSVEYDWNTMEQDSNGNDAAKLLMYHCAVSVEMDFGTSVSAAYNDDAHSAFINYFNYLADYNNGDLSDSQIRSEIDNGRPIYYSGSDGGNIGHAFVLDGYQSGNYFHFNWGWGGRSNEYYFVINNIIPPGYNFSYRNEVIYGIRPNIPCNIVLNSQNTSVNYEATCTITLSPGFSSTTNFRARIVP